MIKLQNFGEILSTTNNNVSKADVVKEKLECVPYVWLYIVSERIENYIKNHLTDERGVVNEEELYDIKYPFYVKINNTSHTHVQTNEESYRQFYSKSIATYKGVQTFEFHDDKVGVYSLKALQLLYFNKTATLRFKHRLQNEFNNSNTNLSLMKMRENGNYSTLTDLESVIAKEVYADVIFKLKWASADEAPEWYYPYPETDVEIKMASQIAQQMIDSKKVNITKANVVNKNIKLSAEFMNKL